MRLQDAARLAGKRNEWCSVRGCERRPPARPPGHEVGVRERHGRPRASRRCLGASPPKIHTAEVLIFLF